MYPEGPKGEQGDPGPRGDKGRKGSSGFLGRPGSKGYKGSKGEEVSTHYLSVVSTEFMKSLVNYFILCNDLFYLLWYFSSIASP